MATLDALKAALRRAAEPWASSHTQPLSDEQYSAGFETFVQGSGWTTYEDFIVPQLTTLVDSLLQSRKGISVLEIGPGPKSILEHLPEATRNNITKYAAFEPNGLFASTLQDRLASNPQTTSPFPHLETKPQIWCDEFVLDCETRLEDDAGMGEDHGAFDIVLFCHSMYGMKPKNKFIEQALDMLSEQQDDAMVVVFHREESLDIAGLASHRTAIFPAGVVSVSDKNEVLDHFASFVAGLGVHDIDTNKTLHAEWRKICRTLGDRDVRRPGQLVFSSPEIMVAFTRHSTKLRELTRLVPLEREDRNVKNREARFRGPTSIIRPTTIEHVQHCVQWALKHKLSLTVLGGGHSGQCLWRNVVAVDMGAFDELHIFQDDLTEGETVHDDSSLIVVGAGCKSADIIHKTMTAGLTVPLGSRPSVGAGLWLQGGIGHLARLHGLTCDNIVGAVVVSVASGQVLCLGRVPPQHQPATAIRPDNEDELLWAMKGAGTNFGIVISITFQAFAAPTYSVRKRIVPLNSDAEAQRELGRLDNNIASQMSDNCSVDGYLYQEKDDLFLGRTSYECITPESPDFAPEDTQPLLDNEPEIVDGIGLFETEMYISGMHGGHTSGKTSSFKRCVFLKHVGMSNVAELLTKAVRTSPTSLCYLHLLHGGGAVSGTASDATAFGCRNWQYACVITGVWPRNEDGSQMARAAVQWVYDIVKQLLPVSDGIYGADLGMDPRDAPLAARAFGANIPRLARLKQTCDPCNVLAYACPLPKLATGPKVVFLVTGRSAAGKDYCAAVWARMFESQRPKPIPARVVSISEATKREYAGMTGADLERLLNDRAYKEEHRPALTAFFQEQVRQRSNLPQLHFLDAVYSGNQVDVLFITGMRDVEPVALFSHLVPDVKLVQVDIEASEILRNSRLGRPLVDANESEGTKMTAESKASMSDPTLVFANDAFGDEAILKFAEQHLIKYLGEDLQTLSEMVVTIPDFPRPGIPFRHVFNIAEQAVGLELCTSLLQAHHIVDWAKIDKIVCCETGGYLFAAPLSTRVGIPLALIREAGKLPPPMYSANKTSSHISSAAANHQDVKSIEMCQGAVRRGSSVLVVDDVLATGRTLCAMLDLLRQAGIQTKNVSVMVVAEFPVHRGRQMIREAGYEGVRIQSLLTFGGA